MRRRIEHFASRSAMDINGLGEKIINRLFELDYLKDISDIYELYRHKEQLINLDGLGTLSINNLLSSIENSKTQPFHKVLFAIGIKLVGEKTAKLLARHFQNIDNLMSSSIDEIGSIYEIGNVIAESVHKTFKDENFKTIIQRLKSNGLNLAVKNTSLTSNKLLGQTFVFTGELEKMTRTEAGLLVENLGGKETKSVSKKTSFVVVGASPGSKLEKAKTIGISILTEEEFLKLIEN